MTCEESEWWDEFVSIWGFLFGDDRDLDLDDDDRDLDLDF